jgi:hypothetical protein
MSANRWKQCPKCTHAELERLRVASQKVADEYGKVSQDDWEKLRVDASPRHLDATLREDWEISIDRTGKFSISYGCGCEVCGFTHEFSHHENVKLQ